MEWGQINDPDGEFVFELDRESVSNYYEPEKIQTMINENGVESMMHVINSEIRVIGKELPLLLINGKGQKMVINRKAIDG